MSEAMVRRHRPPTPALHQDLESLMGRLQSKLAWIEEHGSEAECAQAIEELEELISSYRYHQAALSHQVEKEVVRQHEFQGTCSADLTRGAASTIALARKQSPNGYRSYLVNCRILAEDTPYLAECFSRGELTEAQVLAVLTPLQEVKAERRTEFDATFCDNPDMFESQGPKQLTDTVQRFTLAHASDDQCRKMKQADTKRHVRFSKGKNCVRISGTLPVVAGTALQMHLRQESFRLKKQGDLRTREQIKADLLCTYLLAGRPEKLPLQLHVGLIMTDKTLLLGEREPAYMEGYGYVPPQYARELIAGNSIGNEQSFAEMESAKAQEHLDRLETLADVTRLYTAPGDGELIAMDSKARAFPEKLRRFVRIRDRHCRTPFCDGLVEETDHVLQHHLGGPTDSDNAAGRCPTCNKAKEKPGWLEVVALKGPHTMRVNPGSSMMYLSTAPPATGYLHKPFPQLLRDSKWVRGVKLRLINQESSGPGP
ncbi:HNH endonuclease [Glutamicibacter sp. BW80]|uniref:HNH endonuclease n=2 Tax=unclassified Glutamicibacter TaxID=2627139 RepID=UPI000BB972A5|nr:DUF222 domain-containing protein [Glutamicibacter sp. BW80]PCC30640.1 HNH endonuclease [Glutamicibacter sp. BW80]